MTSRFRGFECYGDVSTATGVIHRKYIGELLKNEFLPGTRAQRMKAEESVEAIVLAGADLPLLLRGFSLPDLDFLDTAAIHIEAIRLVAAIVDCRGLSPTLLVGTHSFVRPVKAKPSPQSRDSAFGCPAGQIPGGLSMLL